MRKVPARLHATHRVNRMLFLKLRYHLRPEPHHYFLSTTSTDPLFDHPLLDNRPSFAVLVVTALEGHEHMICQPTTPLLPGGDTRRQAPHGVLQDWFPNSLEVELFTSVLQNRVHVKLVYSAVVGTQGDSAFSIHDSRLRQHRQRVLLTGHLFFLPCSRAALWGIPSPVLNQQQNRSLRILNVFWTMT